MIQFHESLWFLYVMMLEMGNMTILNLFLFPIAFNFRFLCKDTVEEKIVELQQRKKTLATNVLTGYIIITIKIDKNI